MYDLEIYKVLCTASIRKLYYNRNCARHGKDARQEIKKWINDLRRIKTHKGNPA